MKSVKVCLSVDVPKITGSWTLIVKKKEVTLD